MMNMEKSISFNRCDVFLNHEKFGNFHEKGKNGCV